MAVLPVPQLRPLNAGQGLRDIGAGVQGAIEGGMRGFQTGRKMEQEAAKEVRDVNRAKLDDQIKQDKINAEKARIERDIKTREGRKKLAEDAIEAYRSTAYEGEDVTFINRNVDFLKNLPTDSEENVERILKATVRMDADSRSGVALDKAGVKRLRYPTTAYLDDNFEKNLSARDKEVLAAKTDGVIKKIFSDVREKSNKWEDALTAVMESPDVADGTINKGNVAVWKEAFLNAEQRAGFTKAAATATRANTGGVPRIDPEEKKSNDAFLLFQKKAEKAEDVIEILGGDRLKLDTDRKKMLFFKEALETRKGELSKQEESAASKMKDNLAMSAMASYVTANLAEFGGKGFNNAQIEFMYKDIIDDGQTTNPTTRKLGEMLGLLSPSAPTRNQAPVTFNQPAGSPIQPTRTGTVAPVTRKKGAGL